MIGGDAMGAVVGLRGMLQQADEPDVRSTEGANILESFGSERRKLACAVLSDRAVGESCRGWIAP